MISGLVTFLGFGVNLGFLFFRVCGFDFCFWMFCVFSFCLLFLILVIFL